MFIIVKTLNILEGTVVIMFVWYFASHGIIIVYVKTFFIFSFC